MNSSVHFVYLLTPAQRVSRKPRRKRKLHRKAPGRESNPQPSRLVSNGKYKKAHGISPSRPEAQLFWFWYLEDVLPVFPKRFLQFQKENVLAASQTLSNQVVTARPKTLRSFSVFTGWTETADTAPLGMEELKSGCPIRKPPSPPSPPPHKGYHHRQHRGSHDSTLEGEEQEGELPAVYCYPTGRIDR